jgi:hypothetical protein
MLKIVSKLSNQFSIWFKKKGMADTSTHRLSNLWSTLIEDSNVFVMKKKGISMFSNSILGFRS